MSSVVLTCGPVGSGKSTHALGLERVGHKVISFDAIAWEIGYCDHPLDEEQRARVQGEIRARVLAAVASGRDVVVDSSFWSRVSRDEYRALLAPLGVTPVVHYLRTPPQLIRERVSARTHSGPHDIAVAPELVEAYIEGFEVPTEEEGPLVVVHGAESPSSRSFD